MSRKILGLDIQNDAIAAVLLRTTLKGRNIEAYAYVPLTDQDTLEDGLASVLAILAETADLAGAACIAAYPADAVSYRNVRVPFKEPKKIRQILPFELEPELPLPIRYPTYRFSTGSFSRSAIESIRNRFNCRSR